MRTLFATAFLPLAAGLSLGGCATSLSLPPAEAIRFHSGAETVQRGSIRVEPDTGGTPASLEFQTYAAAVEGELLKNGYTLAPAGAQPQYVATVAFTRASRPGPPRSSPFSIGLGGGGFSGGRGGGVGLGGGVGIPIGGSRSSEVVISELAVTIKQRSDQTRIWEGRAHGYADASKPIADPAPQAQRLAAALFQGFPGESGRTIEVK